MLRAPIAGVATQVASIQMGRYLTAGMAVFSIIGSDNVWIDANPKETDLTYVRAGQPVTITVDAFPSRHGAARSPPSAPARARSSPSSRRRTRPATGSRSCSACRCASSSQPGQDLRRLRSGMSATVEIDTGRRGRLARLLGSSAVAQDPDP